jgi:hypothetical protein
MKNGAPTAAPPLTTWQAYVAATAASAPGPLPADPSARLTPADLAGPDLLEESRVALDELTGLLGLGGGFYPFQRN